MSRDEGLVTLERLSLVNKRGERFWMLPLTKGYALSETMTFPDKSGLENRWIDYFVKLSDKYGDEYWNWTNYEWLLAEGDNILALANWAVATDREEIALLLHWAILRYLDVEGRWAELVKYGELLYEIAQFLNNRRVLAWICTHWLGWLYGEQENAARAEAMAREGITLYREMGDKKGECFAIGFLSRALRKSRQLEAGREKAKEMLKLAQGINYNDGIAAAHDQMGKMARDLEMWADAKEHFDKARTWCEKEEANLDVSMLMNILGNLGWVEFNLGNHERGKELCERSLDFFARMGGRGYSIVLQCQLAAIEIALGNYEKARQYAQEALYWAERLQMTRDTKTARTLLEQIVGRRK